MVDPPKQPSTHGHSHGPGHRYGRSRYVPSVRGAEWIRARLPTVHQRWLGRGRRTPQAGGRAPPTLAEVSAHLSRRAWTWTGRRVFFLCDLHADPDALRASVAASGGVALTGPEPHAMELTAAGRQATFVIGGDCFDKGPTNLGLLRAIRVLIDLGADVRILAGNHDVRTWLALRFAERKDPGCAHIFARTGAKTVRLFDEIYREYLAGSDDPASHPSDDEVRGRLFPDESWWQEFPEVARGLCPAPKIEKELRRVREKMADIERSYARLGMTLGMMDATLGKARALFCEPSGEFAWFFDRMQMCWQEGSVLFAHAGVCDVSAAILAEEGTAGLNARFREQLEAEPFLLYNGPIGNVFRTKYRPEDQPFTREGAKSLERAGITAIVHGHNDQTRGQRLALHHGALHFACAASVDRGTRALRGLRGRAAAVTIMRPDGLIVGISTDHARAKVFNPADVAAKVRLVRMNCTRRLEA